MNIEKFVGGLTGMVVGILIVAVILKFTKKDKKIKAKYDERQNQNRGKGYQYGFFTMMFLNVAAIMIELGEIPFPVKSSVVYFFNIIVGVAVYAIYCIFHDSYFSLNENKKRMMILFVIIGAINLVPGIGHIVDGTIMENGMVSYNLLCGALFIAIFIALIIKSVVEKREGC